MLIENKETKMNIFTIILGVIFFGGIGLTSWAVFMTQFSEESRLWSFAMFYFFSIWPLWICFILLKSLIFNRENGKVIFAAKPSKSFLLTNLIVIVPICIILQRFSSFILMSLRDNWTTGNILVVCIFILPILIVRYGLDRIYKHSVNDMNRDQ